MNVCLDWGAGWGEGDMLHELFDDEADEVFHDEDWLDPAPVHTGILRPWLGPDKNKSRHNMLKESTRLFYLKILFFLKIKSFENKYAFKFQKKCIWK